GEEFEIPLTVARAHRGDDLAALTHNDGGVAVVQPRAAIRIPHGLWVEMSVMIDKPGSDNAPLGVDRPFGRCTGVFADPDNPAVLDRDIRGKCRLARAVHDATILDKQIIPHDSFSSLPRPMRARAPSRRVASTGPVVHRHLYAVAQAPAYASP